MHIIPREIIPNQKVRTKTKIGMLVNTAPVTVFTSYLSLSPNFRIFVIKNAIYIKKQTRMFLSRDEISVVIMWLYKLWRDLQLWTNIKFGKLS